jgi:hypothetical protein
VITLNAFTVGIDMVGSRKLAPHTRRVPMRCESILASCALSASLCTVCHLAKQTVTWEIAPPAMYSPVDNLEVGNSRICRSVADLNRVSE